MKSISNIKQFNRVFKCDDNLFFLNYKCTIEILEYYINNYKNIDWFSISIDQSLTEEFIIKHKRNVNWYHITRKQNLSLEFMDKFIHMIDTEYISAHKKLPEEFIIKHADRLNWYFLACCQKLSYEFLEKNLYRFNLYVVSTNNDNLIIKKLVEKYKSKYLIDKLSTEISNI